MNIEEQLYLDGVKVYTKDQAIYKACLFVIDWSEKGELELKNKEFFSDMLEKYKNIDINKELYDKENV